MAKTLKPNGKTGGARKKGAAPAKKTDGGKAPATVIEKAQEVLANSEDAMKSQLDECYRLKKDFEEAQATARAKQSTYRTGIKTAIKIGAPFGYTSLVIVKTLNDRDRPVEEIDRENAQINRLYKLQNIPTGTQLGLWDESTSVATAIEDDLAENARTTPAAARGGDDDFDSPDAIEAAGYKSHDMLMDETDVPGQYTPDQKEAWLRGFRRRKGETTSKVGASLGKANGGAEATA